MGDNVFMVLQKEPSEEASFEALTSQDSPGAFQWTVYEIVIADQAGVGKGTEFRYDGQKLYCTIAYVKTIYQFLHHNYIYR
ncbi:hypothetical protein PGT21_030768 [Puccinia graminis f. sp. tritici]|uniref:Uncharacterized protein n=1 Tax=Puccinia graminis f. sp. tritici TaxID=56615 RepID=A0A5B0PF00_PUCGR|nr:hypothetical protein PGT21_030768 [Puccinia graminis f. sp. tritici]